MTAALAPAVLDAADWQARRRGPRGAGGRLAGRRTWPAAAPAARHPVDDFLFTYYSHRPAQLRRWHPGAGVMLRDADPAEFGRDYRADPAGVTLDTDAVRARRAESIGWIRELLAATAGRPAHFGCFGMHEWAMVYRQTQERGPAQRLAAAARPGRRPPRWSRSAASGAATSTRSGSSPRRPGRSTCSSRPGRRQHALEQPGCLHANMDLYKWAYKLSPLVPSELVADCFALAREIRTLDMRASPYDLAALGYPPVRVETPEGRAEYAAAQRGFAERAAVLRARLLAALDRPTGTGLPVRRRRRPGRMPAGPRAVSWRCRSPSGRWR